MEKSILEKRKKNSKAKKDTFYLDSVTEADYKEIRREYPYLKRNIGGIYYINREGKKKEVILPYVPVLDDDSSVRILFQKARGEKDKPFIYATIDNDEKIMKILENREDKEPIRWRIKPNKQIKNIKKGTSYKSYVLAKSTVFFPENIQDLIGSEASLHRFVMSVYCEKEMKRYKKSNKKKARSMHIDHLDGNELNCRLRNLSIITSKQNLKEKKEIDSKETLDNFCVYRPKNKKGEYVDNKKRYVLFLFLGNEKRGIITKANFIGYNGGKGDIVCAMFNDIDSIIKWYHTVFVKGGEELENVERRNQRLGEFFQKYVDSQSNNEKIEGIERVVLLARTNEEKGYIYFDNISTRKEAFLEAKKRGLVIRQEVDSKTGRKKNVVKSSQNIEVNSRNIVDILYPHIEKIFDL